MKNRQIEKMLKAYGSDPARWPEDKRPADGNWRAGLDIRARGLLEDEALLDAALNRLATPAPASADLRRAMMTLPARTPVATPVAAGRSRRFQLNWWPFGNVFGGPVPQIGGMVLACVLGLVAGFSNLPMTSYDTPDLTEMALGTDTPAALAIWDGVDVK